MSDAIVRASRWNRERDDGAGRKIQRQHLERNGPAQSRIHGFENLPHAAAADEVDDVVDSQTRTRREARVRGTELVKRDGCQSRERIILGKVAGGVVSAEQ